MADYFKRARGYRGAQGNESMGDTMQKSSMCAGGPGVIAITMTLVAIITTTFMILILLNVFESTTTEFGYGQLRIQALQASTANPNITVLTARLMAAYLVEDVTGELDKGKRQLLWIHPDCNNKTFSTCNATALSSLNLLASASALKTAMGVMEQNRTILSSVSYHYLRLYTCDLADTADAGTTFSYRSGNMNVTKAFRDTRCNFTSLQINPPVAVQNQQGIIVTASFNASAIATELDADPVSTTFANLTKSGPHSTKYYTMAYPVWTVSFYQCNTTLTPAFALACAP